MTSSSPDAGARVRVVPFAGRELRSGHWTRLGGSAVLGDAVTDVTTLQTVADRTGGTLQTVPSTQGDALVDIIRKLAS